MGVSSENHDIIRSSNNIIIYRHVNTIEVLFNDSRRGLVSTNFKWTKYVELIRVAALRGKENIH